jgi:hypothetical protein
MAFHVFMGFWNDGILVAEFVFSAEFPLRLKSPQIEKKHFLDYFPVLNHNTQTYI